MPKHLLALMSICLKGKWRCDKERKSRWKKERVDVDLCTLITLR